MTFPVETERLIIRPFQVSDTKEYYHMTNDDEISIFVPYAYTRSIKEAYKYIREYYINSDFENDFYLLLEEKNCHKLVGAIFINKSENEIYDVSALTSLEFRKKGYMLEALTAIMDLWPVGKTLKFDVRSENKSSLMLISNFPEIKKVFDCPQFKTFHFSK